MQLTVNSWVKLITEIALLYGKMHLTFSRFNGVSIDDNVKLIIKKGGRNTYLILYWYCLFLFLYVFGSCSYFMLSVDAWAVMRLP